VIVWINIYFLSLGPIGLSQGHNLQCASTLTSIIFFVWQLVLGTGSCVKFQALSMLHLRDLRGVLFPLLIVNSFISLCQKNTIGFLHCLPALAFEGGVSIIPNTVTVTHFDSFR